MDNVIDGVVLTFTNISKRVLAEAAKASTQKLAESIVESVRDPLIVLDGALKVVFASRSFYQDFRVAKEDTIGRRFYDLGDCQWNIPKLRELLDTILSGNRVLENFEVEHDFPAIGRRKMLLNARRIHEATSDSQSILLVLQNTGIR